MIDLYRYFKLWYWWYFSIKQDESHWKLDNYNIGRELGRSLLEVKYITIHRREVAHMLDSDVSIWDIPIEKIKLMEL